MTILLILHLNLEPIEDIPSNVSFELPCITESFVYKFLSRPDISTSTGLDGIGPRLLKLSSSVITKSITYIAQACISKGYFPDSWKQAKVNPLYISLLPHCQNCLRNLFKRI